MNGGTKFANFQLLFNIVSKVKDLFPSIPLNIILNVFLLFTATEYRNWLLHYSVPVLKDVLPNQYFIHYTLFVTAISILVSDQISLQKLQQADKLLDNFCKLMPELYGEYTVPLKCKLPPSRETRLVSLETSLVSLEKFLVSRECTASTNALHLGECTNGIIRSNGRTHGKRTDNKRLDKPFETSVERLNGCNIFSNGKVERVNRCNFFEQ